MIQSVFIIVPDDIIIPMLWVTISYLSSTILADITTGLSSIDIP